MGRRTALETKGLVLNDIVKLHNQFKKVNLVSRKTGISSRTIRKYLKEAKVTLHSGRPKGEVPFHFSKLAKWVREHPSKPLPRKPREIAKLTGISANEIRTYLYRRRKVVKDFVESLPDLKVENRIFVDEEGRRIPTRAFKFYILSVDKFTLDIHIRAVLKNGKRYLFCYDINKLKGVIDNDN